MLASCEKNLVRFPGVFAPLNSAFLGEGPFFSHWAQPLNFGEGPSILEKAPPVNSSRAQRSLTAQPLDFGKGPSILKKWRYHQKNDQFGWEKIFFATPKKSLPRKLLCHVLFAKIIKKIRQIWPQQPLKHFTAAYRGFPPCTQSQHPINRETGYSNVLRV